LALAGATFILSLDPDQLGSLVLARLPRPGDAILWAILILAAVTPAAILFKRIWWENCK
jgi:hypothetical protein